jgi:hypothetical protein
MPFVVAMRKPAEATPPGWRTTGRIVVNGFQTMGNPKQQTGPSRRLGCNSLRRRPYPELQMQPKLQSARLPRWASQHT